MTTDLLPPIDTNVEVRMWGLEEAIEDSSPDDFDCTRRMYYYGGSPVERLPMELFDQIIPLLAVDTPTDGNTKRNRDLASCLLVSKKFYTATLSTLYSRVTFPHSYIFIKFLNHIDVYPDLGRLVKRLDFSHFTSVGLGRTAKMNTEIENLTSKTLLRCLNLMPRLREFLASEAIDCDLDQQVLRKLFCGLPQLAAVDFCAAASPSFRDAFTSVVNAANPLLPQQLAIRRLSLHECTSLPIKVFETLLPRLPHLTHLDLSHTRVTDSALMSISETARITHLSLSKCNRLTGEAVVEFITSHPAVRYSLQVLNLLYDAARYRLLSAVDVEDLLIALPPRIVSLNLSGAPISSEHVEFLIPIVSRLEELSLGNAELSIEDLNSLFAPETKSRLHYLDISGIPAVTPNTLLYTRGCTLLTEASKPLEVVELSEKMIQGLKERPSATQKAGWSVKTQGRRGWFIRNGPGSVQQNNIDRPRSISPVKTGIKGRRMSNEHDIGGLGGKYGVGSENGIDDGTRAWKMGGRWWGGRKISCSFGEVGGMYGYYGYGK